MKTNNTLVILLLLLIIIILGYLAFFKKQEIQTVYIPYQQNQQENKTIVDDPKKTDTAELYPSFIQQYIQTHEQGLIQRFISKIDGKVYYSIVTSPAIGIGSTIYDEQGIKIEGCNASLGPKGGGPICYHDNQLMISIIWSKGFPLVGQN